MGRTTFNRKTMEWIVFALREASRDNGTHTRRWKMNEQFADFFCSRKHNRFGRFISIVTVQGGNKSVIILPEYALNTGWGDIALKISNFIKDTKGPSLTDKPRMADPKILYADSVRTSKWQSKEASEDVINRNKKAISITDGNTGQEKGLLARCIVGRLNTDLKELPTLSDIRKWAVNTWKKSFGVNNYEMGDAPFYLKSQTGTWRSTLSMENGDGDIQSCTWNGGLLRLDVAQTAELRHG
uniref:Uncharacterized protein n=1 Tax=Solanum tuberosum TaxID=4113 RepID=M1B194_SOLTU